MTAAMASCPDAPKKAKSTFARFTNILDHENIKYWSLSNGCTAGFYFNVESAEVVLFRLSGRGHIHWSCATEAVTFDRSDWGKFRECCKNFEFSNRLDFFSPEAYRHKWKNHASPQLTHRVRATHFSEDQLSLRISTTTTDDGASDHKENGQVMYIYTNWNQLKQYFNQIHELFQKVEKIKEMDGIKQRLEELF
ncbi:MAG: hypothetical protein ACRCX7_08610 [Cetobacterium sp.]